MGGQSYGLQVKQGLCLCSQDLLPVSEAVSLCFVWPPVIVSMVSLAHQPSVLWAPITALEPGQGEAGTAGKGGG
jgi:hypothetical protein